MKLGIFSLELGELLLEFAESLLFLLQLNLGDCDFFFSLCKSFSLGHDFMVDLVELADSNCPFAKTFSCLRCSSDNLWSEIRVLEVGLNLGNDSWVNVLLVVALQLVKHFLVVVDELL